MDRVWQATVHGVPKDSDMTWWLKNNKSTQTSCIAHRTLLSVMWQPGWEEILGENGYMYMYGWVWGRSSSVQFRHSVMSDSLQPHGLQHASLPCPSPTPRVYSNSCPLSWWCHTAISSSVVPFSCHQSVPASGSFQMSQFFASGGQSIGASASASVLLMNIQDWFPLGWTSWISL